MTSVLLSYRALGLGDLLTAVPALRALRAAHPRHRHVLAAPAWLAPLVELIEAVDVHQPTDELSRPELPAPPDVAVNLHGRGPLSHRAVLATSPRRVIAFDHPDVSRSSQRAEWRDDEHEVERWCRLLRTHGIPADPSRLELPAPAGAGRGDLAGATVIHPGAKAPARRWPGERFAAVARHEREQGRRIVITGSTGEHELAHQVAAGAGLDGSAVLAGRTDLGGLAQVVAGAGRVVSGDTGVAHLATAFATPSVVLFGPTPPDLWGPPPDRRDQHRVLWAGRRGDALGDRPDPGLLEISVADVIGQLDQLPVRTPPRSG